MLGGALAVPTLSGLATWRWKHGDGRVLLHDPSLDAGRRFAEAGGKSIAIEGDRIRFARDIFAAKPALVAGGWDVWINADGYVESFLAEDSIVLEEQVTGDRTEDEQEFADALVRLWDAAATS